MVTHSHSLVIVPRFAKVLEVTRFVSTRPYPGKDKHLVSNALQPPQCAFLPLQMAFFFVSPDALQSRPPSLHCVYHMASARSFLAWVTMGQIQTPSESIPPHGTHRGSNHLGSWASRKSTRKSTASDTIADDLVRAVLNWNGG